MADETELAAVDWIDAAARKYIRDPAELRRANQITAALLRTPAAPPPMPELAETLAAWRHAVGRASTPLKDKYRAAFNVCLAAEKITALLRTPAAPPPAHAELAAEVRARTDAFTERQVDHALKSLGQHPHAELAARLRDRAASMEDSDGMSSDTSKLLYEAATALGGT